MGRSRLSLFADQRAWLMLAAIFGILVGLGAYTFSYAEGSSYLSDDPAACVNCHVMQEQFDGWNNSSHKAVATCNDCHTPHTFLNKWLVKGLNGWNHSKAFTLGNFPNPIRIRPFNAKVALNNCIDCHEGVISQTSLPELHADQSCVSCHGNVGHGD